MPALLMICLIYIPHSAYKKMIRITLLFGRAGTFTFHIVEKYREQYLFIWMPNKFYILLLIFPRKVNVQTE